MKKFRQVIGFNLIEIALVVAIVGILIAIAVPGFTRARAQSHARACQENLQKIESAREHYGQDHSMAPDTAVKVTINDLVLGGYLKVTPTCPDGGIYVVGLEVGTNPTCSLGGEHVTRKK
ncbi:MAG: prepilin-type N-terminal cleavage/methylation domain-containing protein [Patescibacteria group bacterium]|mgnify:FL=1